MRDQVYRLYLDFLETAEKKRRWSIFDSIPWDALDASKSTIATKQGIEVYCSEELYVPDYGSNAIALLRSAFGMAWFQTRWTFEESQHGLVFREYLIRSGSLTEGQFADLEAGVASRTWSLPFESPRQMVCYGALQEGVTYVAYRDQRDKAELAGDKVLEAIFFNVARDEAAHGGFYRAIVSQELSSDRAGTIADLALVLANFRMPGDGLIPGYRMRLESSGAGVPPRMFVERVIWPLITSLKISHGELRLAMKRLRSAAAPS